MHPKTEHKSLSRVVIIAATACILAACSSKPETADIQKDLAEVYACPIIELSDVKKVDGADVGGKLYDAKAYLEIADLFAWTVVIVAVSALFERVFLFLLGKIFDALEHAV